MEFEEIIARLKETISQNLKTKKIYDKDIANALGLKAQYFAVMKKRKKIPFKEIAIYCNKKNISINWILFESN